MGRLFLLVGLSLALACGDDDVNPTTDAGERDANDGVCDVDDDCDDGTFCNGGERCMPSASGADARGCVAGTSPCEDACDEPANECVSCTDPDADGDGFAAIACGGDDCDDGDEDVNPDASEICDPEGFDEDCNPGTFGERDDDGDGFVDARCCNGDLCGTDCDDGDDAIRPDASEVCNRRDDDCDGAFDEDVAEVGFVDADSDGRGDPSTDASACPGSARFSTVGDDCDDDDPARSPAQVEVCDGVDNDCDGRADEQARAVPWYPDGDGDGFGDASAIAVVSCGRPEGHVLNAFDCDDTRSTVSPRAEEQCNGRDDDCDGVAVFDGLLEDRDGDGIPDARCGGEVVDCDDGSVRTGPGAIELCNGRDDDCDGRTDETVSDVMWYLDEDRDGFGSDVGISSCAPPGNYVLVAGDCAPRDAYLSPAAAERCDSVDQDCDGRVDEQQAIAQCAATDRVCRGGLCVATGCPAGRELCDVLGGTECIDTAVDASHCSGCNLDCPNGQLCRDSGCVGWDEIELGGYPNCARSGGRVYCWGREVGAGVDEPSSFERPQTVVGIDDAITVEAGGPHACVLRAGNEAWCWGLNNYGNLGDNTTTRRNAPVRVATALRFSELAVGGDTTCGRVIGAGPVAADSIYCWGGNEFGVARPRMPGLVLLPTRLSETLLATNLDVGANHACAANGEGLWCWGTNDYGQLGPFVGGESFVEPRRIVASIPGVDEVRNVATGSGHTCFVTSARGAVRCLGRNSSGQAGGAPSTCTPECLADETCADGACVRGVTAPQPVYLADGVTPLEGVIAIDAGDRHTCALRLDRTVWCWGTNASAELAQADTVLSSRLALQVTPRWGGMAYELSVGASHACVRADGGAVWCWGANTFGQNGTGLPFTRRAEPLLAPVR